MSDVLSIATKRLETLKAEMAKIEQFLAFAEELQNGSSGKAASEAPSKAPEAKASEAKADDDDEPASAGKSAGTGDVGGFQLTRDHMVSPGGGLRDSARRANGT